MLRSRASALVSSARSRVPYRLRSLVRPPVPHPAGPWLQPSFSQTGEDRIVAFLFSDLLGVSAPSYFDIGAYHPFHLSNTALLHLRGSRGINVEPDPGSFAMLERFRPRDVNLNVGMAVAPGTLSLYRMSVPTLNTFSKAEAERLEAEGTYRVVDVLDVPVQTVAEVLDAHWPAGCPDFLSIDVEGNDADILAGMDTWPGRPSVICTETLTFAPDLASQEKIDLVAEVMSHHDYSPFAETYLNTIYVRADLWSGRIARWGTARDERRAPSIAEPPA